MIKATMVCTNCKEEKEIARAELEKAVELDNMGELNLCSDCRKLWETEVARFREDKDKRFIEIQERFGIKREV